MRAIKYGETSLIVSIFTEHFGVQSYLVQGVRKTGQNKSGLLQPATLLELEAYQQPQKNLQRLKTFNNAYFYKDLQQDVVKNCIALFSVEVLLRLLPEHAPLPDLFAYSFHYFQKIDDAAAGTMGNYPLYFIIQCGNLLGFELKGAYSLKTPYLNIEEGGFSEHPPLTQIPINSEEADMLTKIASLTSEDELNAIIMHSDARYRLIDWYLDFLHRHTQHLGQIRSLPVLRNILH